MKAAPVGREVPAGARSPRRGSMKGTLIAIFVFVGVVALLVINFVLAFLAFGIAIILAVAMPGPQHRYEREVGRALAWKPRRGIWWR